MQRPATSTGFEQQLEAYSAASKSIASASNWRDRLGGWPIYAAATASALACATSASADSIVYVGGVNFSVSIPTAVTSAHSTRVFGALGAGAHFDLTVNRELMTSSGSVRDSGHAFVNATDGKFLVLGEINEPKKLVSGAAISSRAGSFWVGGNFWYNYHGVQVAGSWGPANRTGFVGFRLGSRSANYEFGWMRLSVTGNGSGYPTEITLIDYAYNSAVGQSIEAGQEASTPEPAGKALMLLAVGFAGVLAWRRRRAA